MQFSQMTRFIIRTFNSVSSPFAIGLVLRHRLAYGGIRTPGRLTNNSERLDYSLCCQLFSRLKQTHRSQSHDYSKGYHTKPLSKISWHSQSRYLKKNANA